MIVVTMQSSKLLDSKENKIEHNGNCNYPKMKETLDIELEYFNNKHDEKSKGLFWGNWASHKNITKSELEAASQYADKSDMVMILDVPDELCHIVFQTRHNMFNTLRLSDDEILAELIEGLDSVEYEDYTEQQRAERIEELKGEIAELREITAELDIESVMEEFVNPENEELSYIDFAVIMPYINREWVIETLEFNKVKDKLKLQCTDDEWTICEEKETVDRLINEYKQVVEK